MISMKTDMKDLEKMCDQMVYILEECIIDEFIEWAKQDDEYLRNNQGFNDHTGNLRSSLGAVVAKDTQVVFSTPFRTILSGAKGSAAGKMAAEQAASAIQGRIAKIMVAGMDYAQVVEDIESKDVLESRRIQCENEARGVMERAMKRAEQKFKEL